MARWWLFNWKRPQGGISENDVDGKLAPVINRVNSNTTSISSLQSQKAEYTYVLAIDKRSADNLRNITTLQNRVSSTETKVETNSTNIVNLDVTKTSITGYRNLNVINKVLNMPTVSDQMIVLARNFDMNKCLSLTVWFKRTSGGPWMTHCNNDQFRPGQAWPATVEVGGPNGIGDLQLWRQAQNSQTVWTHVKISIIYDGTVNWVYEGAE